MADRDERAILGLLLAAATLRKRLAAALRGSGVTLQQYNVLRLLGAAPAPCSVSDLRARLVDETPGVSRLLDRLVAKGLVTRARARSDRRVVECALAPAGARLLSRCEAGMRAASQSVFRVLPPEGVEVLADLLSLLVETEPPGPG